MRHKTIINGVVSLTSGRTSSHQDPWLRLGEAVIMKALQDYYIGLVERFNPKMAVSFQTVSDQDFATAKLFLESPDADYYVDSKVNIGYLKEVVERYAKEDAEAGRKRALKYRTGVYDGEDENE